MDPAAKRMNQQAATARSSRSWWKPALGYLLAGLCLAWVFHDIHPQRLRDHLAAIQWSWVALAVVLDVLSYFCQGWRWQLLLRPEGTVSALGATEAIYVGLFANEVLPLRAGELIRMYLVARRMAVSFVRIVPSVALERLFDGVWLALGIGLMAIFIPLPRHLAKAADVFGVAVLLGITLFLVLVLWARKSAPASDDLSRRPPCHFSRLSSQLAKSLRGIRLNGSFFLSFVLSLLFLLLQGLAFWLVMWAYGLRLSFWVGLAVLIIVHLGTAIPNAPANVGTYQLFTVLGLGLFGVEKTLATGFSVVVFVILTVPLWALGLWALARSGMTLAALREETRRLKQREATAANWEPAGPPVT